MSPMETRLTLPASVAAAPAASRVPANRAVQALVQLLCRIRYGRCLLILPDGQRLVFAGEQKPEVQATLRLETPAAAHSLLTRGAVGFAEAYVDGHWNTPDLPGLLEFAVHNEPATGSPTLGRWLARQCHRLYRLSRANTRRGSRRNAARHYDLGNAFYRPWLGASMTYSSALFEALDQSLDQAQANKYRRLTGLLELRPGLDLLEIGCGWGEFARLAARAYGCRVTAITLSRAQAAWAQAQIAAAGLAGRVEIRLQDYRDVTGSHDRIASIEMIEAVGRRYWPTYFRTIKRRLRPGGVAALQAIILAEQRSSAYRQGTEFIQRHIFPGGYLPSASAIDAQ